MILDIIFILIFAYSIFIGRRRGAYFEGLLLAGYALVFIIALFTYRALGKAIELIVPYPSASQDSKFAFFSNNQGFDLYKSFYAAVAFLFILVLGWIVVKIISKGFTNLTYHPISQRMNDWISIIISFIVTLNVIYIILFITSTIPIDGLQNQLNRTLLTKGIYHFPIISQLYQYLFVALV